MPYNFLLFTSHTRVNADCSSTKEITNSCWSHYHTYNPKWNITLGTNMNSESNKMVCGITSCLSNLVNLGNASTRI